MEARPAATDVATGPYRFTATYFVSRYSSIPS
jgi:hypothetical protein